MEQEEILLKARAIELIRAEREKASKRKRATIFAAGVIVGLLFAAWFSVHRAAIAAFLFH